MITDQENRRRPAARCAHPRRAVQYQVGGAGAPDRIRCTRCGQQLLALDGAARRVLGLGAPPARPRDKRRLP